MIEQQTLAVRADPDRPGAVLQFLFKQFACPTGWLGTVAGRFMAKNTYDDAWIVELLDPRASDRVLDVGFGPGVAVSLLADRTTAGLVAGIDPSEVMVRQATQRNRAAVQAGRVALQRGSIEHLPYPDGSFDKACAIHSIYFWPSQAQGAAELHRVLAPGGRLAVAVRMRRADAGPLNPSRYGLTDAQVADMAATFAAQGFGEISTSNRTFPREQITAILATRQA